MKYQFTLTYRLAEPREELDSLIERLGAAGCDDALIGIGLPGRLALDFTRQAKSAKSAITSALADVKHAIPNAELIEASPDLVGLSDAADVVGVSRQNLRKLMLSHPNTFPLPVHSGTSAFWHLEDLVIWLNEQMHYEIPTEICETAGTTKQVNLARQARRIKPSVRRDLQSLIT
jgi:hypothetical protein